MTTLISNFSLLCRLRRRVSTLITARSDCLPFFGENARYRREVEVAANVVRRACKLCVEVRRKLVADDGGIVEKSDRTPVTVADFGVQGLVSLELSKWFPSIPLVAEEDSTFLRSNNLVKPVVNAVNDHSELEGGAFTDTDVLGAIDRGGQSLLAFGAKPATYWVLDPIDGTRGFVIGGEVLYVVGLALIVEGKIVLGAMGCPNWPELSDTRTTTNAQQCEIGQSQTGILMVAHIGCGTWRTGLSIPLDDKTTSGSYWTRCFVDQCCFVHLASFCISDSQTWDSLPLSHSFHATTDAGNIEEKQVLLLPTCCGSLCKYLMVASGRASVFILRARAIIKAWDHAVGVICVHEAGGQASDWKGRLLDFAADESDRRVIFPSGGVLVTNGNLQDQILRLISSPSDVS
ncbi:hypothetical protein Droror1_Dr00010473 [Drosera rotundifolia]